MSTVQIQILHEKLILLKSNFADRYHNITIDQESTVVFLSIYSYVMFRVQNVPTRIQ